MSAHDPQISIAEAVRRAHVFAFLRTQRFAADEPRVCDPADDRDRDVEVEEPGTQHRHDRNHDHEERKGCEDVDEATADDVEQAAVVAGKQTDNRADDKWDRDPEEADLEVDAGSRHYPGQDVATKAVGSEWMLPARMLQDRIEVLRIRAIGADHRSNQRDENEQRDAGNAYASRPAGADHEPNRGATNAHQDAQRRRIAHLFKSIRGSKMTYAT